jgi:hypothetical protein
MRLRTKILLTIFLAVLTWALLDYFEAPTEFHDDVFQGQATDPTKESLRQDYQAYNEMYFGDKLPHDVIINFDETDPEYYATTRLISRPIIISFNPYYRLGIRHTRLVLLHEMCHVRVGNTMDDQTNHGIRWKVCMLGVDVHGAFRTLLIDGYHEDMP